MVCPLLFCKQRNDGQTDVPLGAVQFNGAAASAQNMSNMVNQITSGQGVVKQSTHIDDWVGTSIGDNVPTGGLEGVGISSHSSYTGSLPPEKLPDGEDNPLRDKTNQSWESQQISPAVIVLPNNGIQ